MTRRAQPDPREVAESIQRMAQHLFRGLDPRRQRGLSAVSCVPAAAELYTLAHPEVSLDGAYPILEAWARAEADSNTRPVYKRAVRARRPVRGNPQHERGPGAPG